MKGVYYVFLNHFVCNERILCIPSATDCPCDVMDVIIRVFESFSSRQILP